MNRSVSARIHWLCAGCLLAWAAGATGATPRARSPVPALPPGTSLDLRFDPGLSHFGFEVRTRWGIRVEGRFPDHGGALTILPDGRQQVHVRLATGAVEVDGSDKYTGIARGEGFFDSTRHPVVEFISQPYRPELVHDGGRLRGRLTMHGTSRMETFTVAPATCARPGWECDVVATGVVERDRYGLDGWRLALSDKVRFNMRVRLQEGETE